MEFKHQHIDLSSFQRAFVIGDIHGKLGHLKHTLQYINFNPINDVLICVGDLIDRGPQSADTLRFYSENDWFHSIAGNHELMMSNAMSVWTLDKKEDRKLIDLWCKNGGDWALKESIDTLKDLLNIVEEMPCALTCHLTDNRKVGISHAQPHSLDWTEMENWQGDMLDNPRWIWGRTRFQGQPSDPVTNIDFTVHGHTRSEKILNVANSYFIDTASQNSYTGPFTLFELISGEVLTGLSLQEWESL